MKTMTREEFRQLPRFYPTEYKIWEEDIWKLSNQISKRNIGYVIYAHENECWNTTGGGLQKRRVKIIDGDRE